MLGEMAKVRNIIFFRISPYEQKAFAGYFKDGVPSLIRRMRQHVLRVVPFFLFSNLVMDLANQANLATHKKDHSLYENDT